MHSVSRLIFKTIAGGVWGALIFLGLGSIKEFLEMFIVAISGESGLFSALPLSILSGAFFLFWLSGDFILIAAFIGAEIAFLKNLHNFFQVEKKIHQVILLCALAITVFSLSIKVTTIFQIESAYSSFCSTLIKKDYSSTYDFFTPKYRKATNFNQFTEKFNKSSFVYGCETNQNSMKFVSSFGYKASVFPRNTYTVTVPFSSFLQGPELIMNKINGKWLFTGEENWHYLP
ncbi:MAG: hypothetical protein IPP66_17680 [Anaerolineales bacterium]|nr:hypothetical protein [Anaerolineales bacterium]